LFQGDVVDCFEGLLNDHELTLEYFAAGQFAHSDRRVLPRACQASASTPSRATVPFGNLLVKRQPADALGTTTAPASKSLLA